MKPGIFAEYMMTKKMQHNFYTELHLIKKKIFFTKNLQHSLKFGIKPQKSSE